MRHQKPATAGAVDPVSPFIVDHEFDDVDELAEVTKEWDLDFRQLNQGPFSGSVRQAIAGPVHLARTELAGVLHQRGTTPPDVWTFSVPGVRPMDFCWRGYTVGGTDLLIHQPGGEFESISKHDFELLLISVSREKLEGAARRLGLAFPEHAFDGLEITSCDPEILSNLRDLVAIALALLVDGRPLTKSIEQKACEFLIRGLAPEFRSDRRPSRDRRRLIDLAVRLARDRAHEIPSVKELCRESGASERTLRRGFNERFGLSPKAYLQAQRLIGVRRQLRNAGSHVTITDIANRWGFWHMGQFASDYRRQFGELPSQTLRTSIYQKR